MPLQFLLWAELSFVWAAMAYGVGRDAMPGNERGSLWQWTLGLRLLIAGLATYCISESVVLCVSIILTIFAQVQLRFHFSRKMPWMIGVGPASILLLGLVIWHYQLAPKINLSWILTEGHLAALCATLAMFLCIARGGGYFVAVVLNAIGTPKVTEEQLKFGYTIGIVERVILTTVVAYGSFDALAFLVAAKGLIRAKEFDGDKSKDFTEYFIAGTLLSVLLAIGAGLTVQFVLTSLWPELLGNSKP